MSFASIAFRAVATVFLATAVAAIVTLWRYRRRGPLPDNLPPATPGPPWLFLHLFLSRDLPWTLLEHSRRLGSVFRLPFPGGRVVAIVGDPSVARRVLDDPSSTKTRAYSWMEKITDGENFFSANGARCGHVRGAVTPAFGAERVERMMGLCRSHVDEWIRTTLEGKAEAGDPLYVFREMQRITTRFIVEAAFEYKMSDEEVDSILSSFHVLVAEHVSKRALNPLRKLFPRFYPQVAVAKRAIADLRSFSQKILKLHRQNPNPPDGTVISLIIDDAEYESDDERARDLLVFLFGGYETTAITLSFALLELAMNPSEQEALYEDLGSRDRLDAERSPALRNVIRETLRLHPAPAVASVRRVSRDVDAGRYVIPKGSSVCVSAFLIHRNGGIFRDADSFKPSRWQEQDGAAADAFMPFGSGRRSCLGRPLANAELCVILSSLCAAYKFGVVDEGTYDYMVTHKKVGTRLSAQRRRD